MVVSMISQVLGMLIFIVSCSSYDMFVRSRERGTYKPCNPLSQTRLCSIAIQISTAIAIRLAATTLLTSPSHPTPPPIFTMGSIVTPDQSLDRDLAGLLKDVKQRRHSPSAKDHKYLDALETGLLVLDRRGPHPDTQAWGDAIDCVRDVILSPKDDSSRAAETWARSCSDLARELMSRFGPSTIQAARDGCRRIVEDHFGGDGRRIAHVEKKAAFLRNFRNHKVTPGTSSAWAPSRRAQSRRRS
jgi:hypothetical protein